MMAKARKSQMVGWYNAWNASEDVYLADVYDSASTAKYNAYKWCRKKFVELDGERFRIIGHNCMMFTVAYVYPEKETGELIFRVETAYNTYEMPLADVTE